ncbi:MAG: SLC45 family MFS transporter [Ruminococcaceae bacterium]|nr:SLC45 family MFS transporter [Oscillospiraceae bacterium]
MKLNYKRTLLVGFAFFAIMAFWQAYDSIVPKILTDKFGLSQFWSGAIMALDNILAVVLLPLFGALSDKHNGRLGRRTPFILVGTIAASVIFIGLSIADNLQRNALAAAGAMEMTDTEARQAVAASLTAENPTALVIFMALLFLVLLAMALFRSPAVALMPDVTPRPLRSKANAMINLMGTFGGILVLVLGIAFGTGKPENALMSYTGFFAVTSAVMLTALVIFMLTVKEKPWAKEADAINDTLADEPKTETVSEKRGLTKEERRSLFFILASVVLWYMGYNAVTSKYSVYAGEVLKLDFNMTLIVAQGAAILSYIPVGIISQKLGRKKTILAGVVMLGIAFTCAAFMREGSNAIVMNILFALAGIGWATINVNSYPMAVELASAGDVGKYTGYYYTASMAAQIITPMVSGIFLTYVGMETLFPYAAIFVAGAFVTMLMVRHGDAKPIEKKSILEHLDVEE